VRVVQNMLP